ncbi:hypothetical protein J6590_101714 [Homalodisca vitripennis]|nr:hypothetical protein J6590_101714 [Homalodisca vitripennis]
MLPLLEEGPTLKEPSVSTRGSKGDTVPKYSKKTEKSGSVGRRMKKIAHKRYKSSLNLVRYYELSNLRDTCKSMSREFLSHVE